MLIKDEIEKVIKDDIAPLLEKDGGSVEFIEYKKGTVKVKLQGACATCPFSVMTLQNLVEKTLKSKIPEIKKVVNIEC